MKHDYNFIKASIESEGYVLLSSEYIGAHSPMEIQCPKGHVFTVTWNKWISHNRRCKYCSGNFMYIDDVRKLFSAEGYELLSTTYINSKSKLQVRCPVGHEFSISLSHWKRGIRCKQCYADSLKTARFNQVKSLFDSLGYELLTKEDEFVCASGVVRGRCDNGHEFKVRFGTLKKTRSCPICNIENRNNKLRLSLSYIDSSFSEQGYTLKSTEYRTAFDKISYVCPNGHNHITRWNDWQQGCRCPYCSNSVSTGEKEVSDFLSDYTTNIILKDRSIISPYELDIVLPDKKLAIEYCGLYWHSELRGKGRNYHLNKLNLCQKRGIRLITIFEDEWVFKKSIVKSRLSHILDLDNFKVIGARSCRIKEIDTNSKNEFLINNHIQGSDISKIRLGAFYKGSLLAVMTFSKLSIAKGSAPVLGNYELSRFCSRTDYRVIGIASKLFKHFLRTSSDCKSIISYADKRWSEGDLYFKLGFDYESDTKPSYWYSKNGLVRYHRFGLRKAPHESPNLTELELRKSEGYYRIWDCGNLKFRFVNK